MTQTVLVEYAFVKGVHFFIPGDEATQGLCVAHQDLKTAYEAVSEALTMLFKMNHNEEAEFSPAIPVENFCCWLTKQQLPLLPPPKKTHLWSMAAAD